MNFARGAGITYGTGSQLPDDRHGLLATRRSRSARSRPGGTETPWTWARSSVSIASRSA